ncbi:hypothetical protein COB64_04680 [Candidatus Wolfebacteria bacterium]|nr:MAG: hypothetical protein COB64_04680 [Candidatus Wolfebacteria bacterium]
MDISLHLITGTNAYAIASVESKYGAEIILNVLKKDKRIDLSEYYSIETEIEKSDLPEYCDQERSLLN